MLLIEEILYEEKTDKIPIKNRNLGILLLGLVLSLTPRVLEGFSLDGLDA